MNDSPDPSVPPIRSARAGSPVGTVSLAPVPARRTLRMRTCVPYQVCRFGRINLRMLRMIRRSHSH